MDVWHITWFTVACAAAAVAGGALDPRAPASALIGGRAIA